MILILKAIGRTLAILGLGIFWVIVLTILTHNGALGIAAFWIEIFLGILAFMIDDLCLQARRG